MIGRGGQKFARRFKLILKTLPIFLPLLMKRCRGMMPGERRALWEDQNREVFKTGMGMLGLMGGVTVGALVAKNAWDSWQERKGQEPKHMPGQDEGTQLAEDVGVGLGVGAAALGHVRIKG